MRPQQIIHTFLVKIASSTAFSIHFSRSCFRMMNGDLKFPRRLVDLRSDTVTKPCKAMREAMAAAEVGDDVMKEDPTVNELEAMSAKLFGMEAALFVPSGTMGNLIAIMAHCSSRGDEIIVGRKQHIFKYEQGGYAQIAGVSACILPNEADGSICLEQMKQCLRNSSDFHQPISRLVCLENTHNVCGGLVLPLDYMKQVRQFAKENHLLVHLDGARIVNAAVTLGVSVNEITKYVDSVTMCLSKGLGAPVGSVLGGSREFIEKALRIRKALGGGMRQAGVLAAAGIVALNTAESRILADHKHARLLAKHIDQLRPKITVNLDSVQTNIIMARLAAAVDTDRFLRDLSTASEDGVSVLCFSLEPQMLRFVTHCDVTEEDIHAAVAKIRNVLKRY